jgi:uncharacterized oxidoreductase
MAVTIPHDALLAFTTQVFEASGARPAEAGIVAEHLVTASLLGYDTHGVLRIPQYVEDVRRGVIQPGGIPKIDSEAGATALVDGGWNFGQVGGRFAIDVAIARARESKAATVVARCCNHAGRLGAYTTRAAEQGFLAMAFCNSPIHGHFVAPWGGREGRLATNPISYAVPTGGADPIVADFSTAESSEGAIRLHRNQGRRLPGEWITNAQGEPSTDPNEFYGPPRGAILPFGGKRAYRGFALAILVEILGGLLGGSSISKQQPGNGLAFIVIDPSAFVPAGEFAAMVAELGDYIKSSETAPGFDGVYLPGELDYRTRQQRLRDGIPIDETTWNQIVESAAGLGVHETPGERTAV